MSVPSQIPADMEGLAREIGMHVIEKHQVRGIAAAAQRQLAVMEEQAVKSAKRIAELEAKLAIAEGPKDASE